MRKRVSSLVRERSPSCSVSPHEMSRAIAAQRSSSFVIEANSRPATQHRLCTDADASKNTDCA
eukprot:4508463-Pleurochrysis_carterae.AAC.1